MGAGVGEGHAGTHGCWLGTLTPAMPTLSGGGIPWRCWAILLPCGRWGLWVSNTPPWDEHPWVGSIHGGLPQGGVAKGMVVPAGDMSRWCRGAQGGPWRFLGERRAPPQPLAATLDRLGSSVTPEAY